MQSLTCHSERPFRDLTPEKWTNLAAAALFIFYVAQIALDFAWQTMCGHIGVDYCDYWSAGRIANTLGYSRMYDLQVLGAIERSIFPRAADPSLFITSPFGYLPIFVLPFQLLSLLSPAVGFAIWTLLNLAGLIVYLRFFAKSFNGNPLSTRLLMLVIASLPFFLNTFYGQVDVWLAVCVGEFMRASFEGKMFRAGMWLGGLLMKPQLLLVLGLVLLLQRALKTLAGLAASSAVIVGLSMMLMGKDGIALLTRVWLGFAAGLPSNETESMMNWRMVGAHLANLVGPWIGWSIGGAGMLATLAITLYVWRRPFQPRSPRFSISMLGIMAASTLLAWHSHVHVALLLVPPLVDLRQKDVLPARVMAGWVLVPGLLFAALLLPENLMKLNLLSNQAQHFVFFWRGAGEFGASLYLLLWAAVKSRGRAKLP